MGLLRSWIPWRGTSSLADTIEAVRDTYLYFIPRVYDLQTLQQCVPLIAKEAQIRDFQMPHAATLREYERAFQTLLPGYAFLINPDVNVRAAYVALLLKDFPKAHRIRLVEPVKIATFLQTIGSWEENLLHLVHEKQILPTIRNPELKYVSYEYWKTTLNVTEDEIDEIETEVERWYQTTKLPKKTLYSELYVSITRDEEINQKYQIVFFQG